MSITNNNLILIYKTLLFNFRIYDSTMNSHTYENWYSLIFRLNFLSLSPKWYIEFFLSVNNYLKLLYQFSATKKKLN